MSAFRRTFKFLPSLHRHALPKTGYRSYTGCYDNPHSPYSRPRQILSSSISTSYGTADQVRISSHFHTSPPRHSSVIPFKLSDIGEGIAEVTIKEWYVDVGDEVYQFDNICEVQSDKATVTITSRYDGKISAIHFGVDDICKVGQALVDIEVTDAEVENLKPSVNAKTPAEEPTVVSPKVIEVERKEILAAPAVRKLAADNKVDLSLVPGTGKGGRITKEDITKFISSTVQAVPPYQPNYTESTRGSTADESPEIGSIPTAHFYNTPPSSIASTEDTVRSSRNDQVIEIKGIAKVMVSTMTAAQAVPRFTFHDEYNVNNLLKLKKYMKETGKQNNVKITFMSFLIKAASEVLLQYPMINAHVNADCTAITYKDLSIVDIAMELARLKDLSAANRLSTTDVTGGTFSLSNVGAVGGTYATPMLVVPEVCIGAFGKVQTRPAFNKDGDVVASNIMSVSWSGDHRVLDGATVARYSNTLRDIVENPGKLLFTLK